METDGPGHPGSLALEAWCKSDWVRDSSYLEKGMFYLNSVVNACVLPGAAGLFISDRLDILLLTSW